MRKLYLCLMVIMLSFVMIIPSSYARTFEDLPELPTSDQPYFYGISYEDSETGNCFYTIMKSNAPFYDSLLYTTKDHPTMGTLNVIRPNNISDDRNAVYAAIYKLNDNEWQLTGTYQRTDDTIYLSVDETTVFLYATENVYNEDGSVFFTETPPVMALPMEEIMKTEMPKFQDKTVGTMKILVLCGVGLIALLVVLNLFGKVFRIFQVK